MFLRKRVGELSARIMFMLYAWYFIGREIRVVRATGNAYGVVSARDGEFFILTTSGGKSTLFYGLQTRRVHFSMLRRVGQEWEITL